MSNDKIRVTADMSEASRKAQGDDYIFIDMRQIVTLEGEH